MHKKVTTDCNGEKTTGWWSGKGDLPQKGARLGIPFGNCVLAGVVVGYFHGGEWQEGLPYIGVKLEPESLPAKLLAYGIASELAEARGRQGIKDTFLKMDLRVGLFGAETKEAPEDYEHPEGLTGEEEMAAIAAIVLGGKKWEETLSGVWMDGRWMDTPYSELAPPLQRIRNNPNGHMRFVEQVARKHAEAISILRGRMER